MARLMGVRIFRIYAVTFAVSVAITGLAGSLVAQTFVIYPQMGLPFTITAFCVVVLGGIGICARDALRRADPGGLRIPRHDLSDGRAFAGPDLFPSPDHAYASPRRGFRKRNLGMTARIPGKILLVFLAIVVLLAVLPFLGWRATVCAS